MLIPTCMVKLLELTLAVACLTLHQYSYDLTDIPTLILCSGTYLGFTIVFSGEIVAETVSAVADAYVDAWWSGTGAVLFGACGYMTLRGWRDVPDCARRSQAMELVICSLVTAVFLLLNSVVILYTREKVNPKVNFSEFFCWGMPKHADLD